LFEVLTTPLLEKEDFVGLERRGLDTANVVASVDSELLQSK
jgi:hypothetical protein